jgi:penicillin amidase
MFFITIFGCNSSKQPNLAGLIEPVEILRDSSGVNHIYAKNEHDLFFAQGYAAAKDRLFQFEIWRRQATGTTAEILGHGELKRDIGTRLFRFRGDLKKEFNYYHPRGESIIKAFTDGVNAYIEETEKDSSLLTLEFKLLGIRPRKWTPEVVISRHQGLLGNLPDEVNYGRTVAVAGVSSLQSAIVFEPGNPRLEPDPKIKSHLLLDSVLDLYSAFRKPLRFKPEQLLAGSNIDLDEYRVLESKDESDYKQVMAAERQNIGSNNWLVGPQHTTSGSPILANDPHRSIAVPSLRYMVHLNAPGWNVVGGGEPTIPGVSIGHNDHGAWGLTVFDIDGEDLYVYETNPSNPMQYKYQNSWEDFRVIKDTIAVKGSPDEIVDLFYTRHGPVTFRDPKNNVAYAARCAWMETGGAPYMASLRIDQAKNWEEFREGCSYSHIPGENMIWADTSGTIGWQAVGIAPIRKNWDGLIPVPGDGTYEWDGYLPIRSLPNIMNPEQGFWVTANENIIPEGYNHRDAVGWVWANRFRADRLSEVLASKPKHTLQEMMALQFDYFSAPAKTIVPLLRNIGGPDVRIEDARKRLLGWNYIMDKKSIEAGIYHAWEKKISSAMVATVLDQKARPYIKSIPLEKTIEWLTTPGRKFGKDRKLTRDQFLIGALQDALNELESKLGTDMEKWQYGQPAYHHVLAKHPLSNAVNADIRKKLECGPLPRGGDGNTPGVTSSNDNQSHGASFRMVVDVSDWDNAMFTNSPGQSGNPENEFYRNLFEGWASDHHFRVSFSKPRVEKSAKERIRLEAK